MTSITKLDEAVGDALDEFPAGVVLGHIAAYLVGLSKELARVNGADDSNEIVLEGGSRVITIHPAKKVGIES